MNVPILVRFVRHLSSKFDNLDLTVLRDDDVRDLVSDFLESEKADEASVLTWIDEERHSAELEAILDSWRGKNVLIDIVIHETPTPTWPEKPT
jgi:hypothetical protein